MDLGTTIKTLRKQRAETQADFAVKCKITQTYLSQIENNRKEPNLATLKRISKGLEIPLPIIFYLSLNEDDISPEKRKYFSMIDSPLKSMVNEFFFLQGESV